MPSLIKKLIRGKAYYYIAVVVFLSDPKAIGHFIPAVDPAIFQINPLLQEKVSEGVSSVGRSAAD